MQVTIGLICDKSSLFINKYSIDYQFKQKSCLKKFIGIFQMETFQQKYVALFVFTLYFHYFVSTENQRPG